MRYLTNDPIHLGEWHRETIDPRDGASVEFLGVVRGKEGGRQTPYLDYESYIPMAEQVIHALIEEAKKRWPLHRVCLRHRIGRVQAGEISVIIGVQGPHRKEAFEACQFLMDAIKKDVPIWKREDGYRTHFTRERNAAQRR